MPDSIFSFFGLRENPFKISPDPRFLFVTDEARTAADELVYAVRNRKGLILLTGEVGTGKTMLVRRLLDWLAEEKMPTALIFNSRIRPEHLLDFILHDFGVACDSPVKSDKLMALNQWLLNRYRAGQTPVLIVDEAQGLEAETLEEIRLLLNFETPRDKLLQIVLAGQPELETKLRRHELRQLRQRITIRSRTMPMTAEQTAGYIDHRLRVAGAQNAIFEPDASAAVYAHASGIPRVINVLCEHAMVNACADGSRTVARQAVDQAASECQLDRAESVARILQTGSYSAAELADEIKSILGAVSSRFPQLAQQRPQSHAAAASATAQARPASASAPPAVHFSAFERIFPNAQQEIASDDIAASILSPIGSVQTASTTGEAFGKPSASTTASAAVPAHASAQKAEVETIALQPLHATVHSHALQAEPQDLELRGVQTEIVAPVNPVDGTQDGQDAPDLIKASSDGLAQPETVMPATKPQPVQPEYLRSGFMRSAPRARRAPENFRELLAFWGASFARDARASYRGLRGLMHSLRMRYWNPTVRGVRRETRYLETRIVRFLSDPRWAKRWDTLGEAVQHRWHAAKSAASPHVERILGAQHQSAEMDGRSARSRTMRARAASSVRRWLREPMSSEQKPSRHRTA
jgi:general secretion pathway protein A